MRFTLERLADDGVALTLAAPSQNGAARPAWAPFVALPTPDTRRVQLLTGVARDACSLFARDRAALWSAVRAGREGGLHHLRSCLALARVRPDVLHLYADETTTAFAGLAREWGVPAVASCRGALFQVFAKILPGSPVRARAVAALRSATSIHCVCDDMAKSVSGLGADRRRIRVIRSGLDVDFFRPPPGTRPPAAELRIVSAGWYRWLKGYEYALLAMRRLLDAGVPARLEVMGGDPPTALGDRSDRARIVHTVRDLELEGAVRLTDRVSSEEFRTRLWNADVLLHTSLSEGIPNVVLEAMACGIPVVTTACGGVREAVRDGTEGFVCELRDAPGLAHALETLWGDPELRKRMGRAGRERILAEYELGRQAREFADLYTALAG
jgi:glycosyltransferase involved in cell wall biosynthesis